VQIQENHADGGIEECETSEQYQGNPTEGGAYKVQDEKKNTEQNREIHADGGIEE
jgi:hypothetical protein